MTTERVRVSVLADEIGTPFPPLLFKLMDVCPRLVDNDLTVPASLLELVRKHATGAA